VLKGGFYAKRRTRALTSKFENNGKKVTDSCKPVKQSSSFLWKMYGYARMAWKYPKMLEALLGVCVTMVEYAWEGSTGQVCR
jgi:hypothetical protein